MFTNSKTVNAYLVSTGRALIAFTAILQVSRIASEQATSLPL